MTQLTLLKNNVKAWVIARYPKKSDFLIEYGNYFFMFLSINSISYFTLSNPYTTILTFLKIIGKLSPHHCPDFVYQKKLALIIYLINSLFKLLKKIAKLNLIRICINLDTLPVFNPTQCIFDFQLHNFHISTRIEGLLIISLSC